MVEIAEREKAKGSRVPVHCGGYVAYEGRVFTAAEFIEFERQLRR